MRQSKEHLADIEQQFIDAINTRDDNQRATALASWTDQYGFLLLGEALKSEPYSVPLNTRFKSLSAAVAIENAGQRESTMAYWAYENGEKLIVIFK